MRVHIRVLICSSISEDASRQAVSLRYNYVGMIKPIPFVLLVTT
jgi:hypothetical protein